MFVDIARFPNVCYFAILPIIVHPENFFNESGDNDMNIPVAARSSPLSLVQFEEVLQELRQHHPHVSFDLIKVVTIGDKDKKTSLRNLGKSDFFTKEIDEMLLKKEARIGIHSAKDLPEPLPEGLTIVALTRGVDNADALVMRPGESLASLPSGAVIATSSERREEMVRALRSDLRFCDLRGTIGERLEKLERGEADGVVVAEAALIRLKLTPLNRMIIPGETAAGQGQLAIVAHGEDREMAELFSCMDVRKTARRRILHLGLEAPRPSSDEEIVHCPLIKISPRPIDRAAFADLPSYTHLIFTSKSAVDIFCSEITASSLAGKEIIAVGHATALRLLERGIRVTATALDERAEGIIELLEKMDLSAAFLFWPHSAQARPLLRDYFDRSKLLYREALLYDTLPRQPDRLPDLASIDEISFTSPSTVDAFLKFYGRLPKDKSLKAIGPVTEDYIANKKFDW